MLISSPQFTPTLFLIKKSGWSGIVGRGPHRCGLVNVDAMLRQRGRCRNENRISPNSPLLVSSVLQELGLQCRVPLPVAQVLGGADYLLPFPLLLSNLFPVHDL